ncbi:MAG: hypothetical protein LBQ44_08095 [Treponema sp.]|jgi:hypothetical protein|nr:hypothetical protein [Treponema sp.]
MIKVDGKWKVNINMENKKIILLDVRTPEKYGQGGKSNGRNPLRNTGRNKPPYSENRRSGKQRPDTLQDPHYART